MWWVYILVCSDGSYYTGSTTDMARRLEEHNAGKGAVYTRSRLPVKLRYKEKCVGRSEAQKREAKIKKMRKDEKKKLHMKKNVF